MRSLIIRVALAPLLVVGAHAVGYMTALLAQYRQTVTFSPRGQPPPGPDYLAEYSQALSQLLRGDLGVLPYASGRDTVATYLATNALNSLGLLLIALVVGVVFGVVFGLLGIRRDPPAVRLWLSSLAAIGQATPAYALGSLVIALALLYIIYGPDGKLPIPVQGFGWDAHLILPVLVLMIQPMVRVAQVTAGLLTEELARPYLMVARAYGHPWKRLIGRYAFRNVLAPVVAAASSNLRLMVGELVIVERIFSWTGLGRVVGQVLNPATQLYLHPPLLAGLLASFALLFILADLVSSLLMLWFDPRLRGGA